MSYKGKIRVIVHKLDNKSEFEVMYLSVFDDQLITDIDGTGSNEDLANEIGCGGHYVFDDSIVEILENYKVDDFVEIVGNAYMEVTEHFDGEITEYDLEGRIEGNHRKLNEYQIKAFCDV